MTELSVLKSSSSALQDLVANLRVRRADIENWFQEQWTKTPPLFYASVDLRNAGFKAAPIDTNLFPAGFNNLDAQRAPCYVSAVRTTIAEIDPHVTRLLLIPESHTRNLFYFENVAFLSRILKEAGLEVRIGSLEPAFHKSQVFTLPSGQTITIEPLLRKDDKLGVADFFPSLVLLNHDLTGGIPPLLKGLKQRLLPSAELGWGNRLKSGHFARYAEVVNEFSGLISGLDPWLISAFFRQCGEIDFLQKEGEACLFAQVETILQKIREKYLEYAIPQEPFVVLKADSGTYGLAVLMIKKVTDLANLNRKQRLRMSRIKGGVPVSKVVVQEGVYTVEKVHDKTAETVFYLVGKQVIGGFHRLHPERNIDENLNAPGMQFDPILVEGDLTDSAYLDHVLTRLAGLAAARENADILRGETLQ